MIVDGGHATVRQGNRTANLPWQIRRLWGGPVATFVLGQNNVDRNASINMIEPDEDDDEFEKF